ncbi:MAG TPA: glycoside hydrolase family 97 N-terminal domain-containing protein [Bryobacteraceae bacterium]
MRIPRALGLLCFLPLLLAAAEVNVTSPNGQVQFRLTEGQDKLQYSVTFAGKPVLEPSPVAIVVDKVNLADGAAIGNVENYQTNEKYPWNGPHSIAVDHSNGAKVAITHRQSHTAYTLEIRAYDDGVAFRHIVPGDGARVPDEATGFRLPQGCTLWYHDLEDHYEGVHQRKGLRAVPPGKWMAPPVTIQLAQGAGYAAITEGALMHYSGMGLQADEKGEPILYARLGHSIPANYPFRLRYAQDVERFTKAASITGVITTPWRVVLIGADLNVLVNSDVIHNVAPPPDPKYFPQGLNTDWVKTGRSLWNYLDGGDNSPEGVKEWARLAHELGFEYNVLEGFWSRWPEATLKEVVDYSRRQGVRTIIWRSSSQLRTPEQRQQFFDLCRRTGVAGAKVDFFDSEHKEMIDLYEELLRGAAEHHLVMDFHGCNKPTGNERTWPNLIGLEAIKGKESSPPFAMHEVTLPFTRMLAGLADYTPVIFSGRKVADTTWPHEIANAILLPAPLLVFSTNPTGLLANPGVEMIKSIPSTWDETVVLPQSQIGDVAAFARRKGNTWFLAVNNGPVPKTVRVDLSFLPDDQYRALLLRDQLDPFDMKVEHATLRSGEPLYIRMNAGGGFVGRFQK